MAYNRLLICYLFVCNVGLSSATIYRCNKTATCGCSKLNANVHKIVGGEDAYPASWGWAVSLQEPLGRHFCTGSVVSPLHIITAAHCFSDMKNIEMIEVVVGIDQYTELDSEFAQVRTVASVFLHPNYDDLTMVNDIAVLRLNESLDISNENNTARLCLPRVEPSGKEAGYPADSVSLVAIGWGILKQGESVPDNLHLQQVTVKSVPVHDDTCAEFVTNSTSQFCAGVSGGGKDACQGDSGGPLMRFEPVRKQWVLAGVTSFGQGCGDPRYSGVYTRASVYREWLRSVISDGFVDVLGDLGSGTAENYCNIYIALLSVIQLFLILL